MLALLKKVLKMPEIYLGIAIVAILAFCSIDSVKVENVKLAKGSDEFQNVSLPLLEKDMDRNFKVSFVLKNRFGSDYEMRIIPDDCVEKMQIDGQTVPVKDLRGRCDYSNGFALSKEMLSQYNVKDGSEFLLTLKNGGGDGGIDVIFGKFGSSLQKALGILLLVASALFAFFVARRLKVSVAVALLLALGVALRVGYAITLPNFSSLSYDTDGHVAYVKYIVDNNSIPGVDDCWTCYHPPVYYAASSVVWRSAQMFNVSGTNALQAESLLMSFAFLFLAFAFLRHFLSKGQLTVATSILTFWPVIVMVAPRIGNDQMFYLFHVLCLWGGVRYLKKGDGRNLLLAAIATALAYWTKSTGIVTMGVFVLFAVCGYFGNCRRLTITKSEVLSLAVFALLIVGIVAYKAIVGAGLVGNASGLHSALRVGNEAGNYFYFDLENFLTHPWTSAWKDELGRQYFWNYTLKTSLFGEFKLLETPAGKLLGTLVSASLLGMMAIAARGFWKTKLQAVHWILLLQGAAFLGALAFLRMQHPYACSNDFRYIMPSLLSLIPFVAMGVNVSGASCKWKVFSYGTVALFVGCSFALMILVALHW